MVLCAVFYVLLWVVAAQVASMLMFDEVVTESSVPPPIEVLQWLYDGTISLFVAYIGIMVTTMWFLLPLTVFHRLGFVESVLFAKQGERKNFPVIAAASYLPFMVYFILFYFSCSTTVVCNLSVRQFQACLHGPQRKHA